MPTSYRADQCGQEVEERMQARRPALTHGIVFDAAVTGAGIAVAAFSLVLWSVRLDVSSPLVLLAPLVIAVLAQFPLIISAQGGDAVIGFEFCVLVYLALSTSRVEAGAMWAVGTVLGHALQRKSLRSRAFNIGITNLLGPVAVAVLVRAQPLTAQVWRELFWVGLAGAVYFLLDLVITGASLAVDGEGTLPEVVPPRLIPLPLACFVGVDTLGYLGALISMRLPAASLVLLLVPLGTILIAARAVSLARLNHRRTIGLLDAASTASRMPETAELEAALLGHAQRALRSTSALWTDTPPTGREIGTKLVGEGGEDRYLVARRNDTSGSYFDAEDQQTLDALVAVAAESLARRQLVQEMAYLASHDPLTALGNRTILMEQMEYAVQAAGGTGRLPCVLYVDLDGFKKVNDRMGHHVGDRLLLAVAERLTGCIRVSDTLARIGGDEFVLLLPQVADESEGLEVAARIVAALSAVFVIDGSELKISCSVGLAYGGGVVNSSDLLRNADLALYRAKQRGRSRVETFDPALRTANVARLELEEDLRRAVDSDAFVLHYQPIVGLGSGTVTGFEALARWTHPALGPIPPDTFIPLAEQIGLICRLGERLLRRATADGALLAAAAGRPLSMAVNVSAMQLAEPSFPALLVDLATGPASVQLGVELTESTLLGDDDVTAAALAAISATGIRLSVDDFGVGYSSIAYLHRLTVDSLKIDKSFVSRLPDDPRAVALIEGVCAMATALDIAVIAEGVENRTAAALVHRLGCRYGQGYHFSRGVPLDAAVSLVTRRYDIGRPALAGAPTQRVRARRG